MDWRTRISPVIFLEEISSKSPVREVGPIVFFPTTNYSMEGR